MTDSALAALPEGSYKVPSGSGRGELREKGSRFLGLVMPARTEEEARRRLAGVQERFPDATHHCWAWRLGPRGEERASDDGEPSGTAGVPILQVLRGAELTDVAAVVVRWYGGTKLGKGGLARAYAGAAREALAELPVAYRVPSVRLSVALPYAQHGAVMRLVHPPDVVLLDESYGSEVVLKLKVWASRRASVEAALADLGLAAEMEEP